MPVRVFTLINTLHFHLVFTLLEHESRTGWVVGFSVCLYGLLPPLLFMDVSVIHYFMASEHDKSKSEPDLSSLLIGCQNPSVSQFAFHRWRSKDPELHSLWIVMP